MANTASSARPWSATMPSVQASTARSSWSNWSDTPHAGMALIFASGMPSLRHDLQCCENTKLLPDSQPARVWPSSRRTGFRRSADFWWSENPATAWWNTSGELANTVHQLPGVPVPGSATGSRSGPNIRS
jgi:hypothetical protein